MLTATERRDVITALSRWALSAPNEPMIGFLGGDNLLTPREAVDAVKHRTPDGEALLAMIEHGVRREGLESVVNRLSRPALAENW
jgi:hypothetical protein